MSFFPFLAGKRRDTRPESRLIYFFSQVIGSIGVLVWVLARGLNGTLCNVGARGLLGSPGVALGVLVSGLLVKVGVAPFHGWVPLTVSGVG